MNMEQPLCYCGNPSRFNKKTKSWGKYCSPRCCGKDPANIEKMKQTKASQSAEQKQITNDRRKKTVLERYGVESVMQSAEVVSSFKGKCIEKYGVDNPAKLIEVQQKMEKTNLERYGTKSPAQNKEIQQKVAKTTTDRYGYSSILENPDFREKQALEKKREFYTSLLSGSRLQGKVIPLFSFEEYSPSRDKYHDYMWKCCSCDSEFSYYLENGNIPRCPICYPPISTGKSLMERELVSILEQTYTVIPNIRSVIPNYELDIYLPDYKLAIEFNGTYWHSELGGKKDRSYHLNKTILCEKQGIDLIHIFEWDWMLHKDIILSIIFSKLDAKDFVKYGARKLEIREVSQSEEKDFLIDNHLQGYVSSLVCYGLYENNELLQLLSFGKPRFNSECEWELLRSCSKVKTHISGGLSRLFKKFVVTYKPESVLSYCDRSLFSGKGYEQLGFVLSSYSQPSYWYTKHHKTVESRYMYQKHKLSGILENYNKTLTEWENMQMNGYDRIWDCGNKVYILKLQPL